MPPSLLMASELIDVSSAAEDPTIQVQPLSWGEP